MPRKKTLRIEIAQQSTSNITVAKDVSKKERMEQLSIFLKDYDCKVKDTLLSMEKKKKTVIAYINLCFQKFISEMDQSVMNMTLKDIAEAGGTLESASKLKQLTKRQQLEEFKNAAMMPVKTAPTGLSAISEEDADGFTVPAKKAKLNTVKKRAPSKRIHRSRMATPCNTGSSSVWGQTPLITPKFNPFLPSTPDNERDIKPGERLMSIAGSPVRVRRGVEQSNLDIENVNKNDLASQLADIGIDVTPGRTEKMLQLLASSLVKK